MLSLLIASRLLARPQPRDFPKAFVRETFQPGVSARRCAAPPTREPESSQGAPCVLGADLDTSSYYPILGTAHATGERRYRAHLAPTEVDPPLRAVGAAAITTFRAQVGSCGSATGTAGVRYD